MVSCQRAERAARAPEDRALDRADRALLDEARELIELDRLGVDRDAPMLEVDRELRTEGAGDRADRVDRVVKLDLDGVVDLRLIVELVRGAL